MGRLFLLLFKYRAAFVFVMLEIICGWMIISNDLFVSASVFNSSNRFVANTIRVSNTIQTYFGLQELNTQLAVENAKLTQELQSLRQSIYDINIVRIHDEALISQYKFLDAKVINNSTKWFNNFITINKGTNDDLKPGMGVINQYGVVGKIQSVSEHYAVLASLLHNDVMVSSKIKHTGTIGTTNWAGNNPQIANLYYIPRHVQPQIGDTIVTSGYNAVFPENVLIGTISSVKLDDDKTFYDINIKLANDFTNLSHLFVIKNALILEKDSLESANTIEPYDK